MGPNPGNEQFAKWNMAQSKVRGFAQLQNAGSFHGKMWQASHFRTTMDTDLDTDYECRYISKNRID